MRALPAQKRNDRFSAAGAPAAENLSFLFWAGRARI